MAVTASTSAYRYSGRGPIRTISAPTAASTAINTGDLLFSSSGVATPASAFTWDTDLATTQPEFRLLFLGIANEDKPASDASTRSIQVVTEGVFVYPCAALGGALTTGAFIGPAKDPNNNSLALQLLASVATYDLSIGVLQENAATGATSLAVYIASYLALVKALKS